MLKGYNDLQTLYPELAQEWDYEENGNLYPDAVTANSSKSVWWICRKGHKWRAKINNRNNGNGCPVCNSERHTSYPEYAIIYYLRKNGLKPIHSYKGLGYELDIYIPSQKIAIEYDGYYWHRNKTKKDLDKNAKCNRDGITLYRIREGLLPLNDTSVDYTVEKNGKDLPQILSHLFSRMLGISVDVDLNRDAIEIENLREHAEKECSVLSANPQLAAEWNYEKNGYLKPEHFLPSSGKKVWWKCSEGHEWEAVVSNRYKGIGCPYCSGKKPIPGFNDLQTSNPSLAEEWDYEKNNGLTPIDVMPNSGKKVWWRCRKGHEWQARIADRNRGRRCPYCAGRYAVSGKNDLQTVNPILAKEWDYEKNEDLTPADVLPNSNKMVWWKCKNGHQWQAVINSRNSGCGCPYCAGLHPITGETDLQTVNPTLASEWNYEKNAGLMPNEILPNSKKIVWWKCSKGHEWQATVSNRNLGNDCPYCSGKKVLAGYNDLKTANSSLAKEWNYEKNSALTPEQFTANSGKKVWWKCSKGHEWQATIDSRTSGCRCPYCSGRFVTKGVNDLQSLNPALAEEWNYEKNDGLTPDVVMPNSHKKVWWKCNKGHEWQADIGGRNRGNGCPQCARESRKKY